MKKLKLQKENLEKDAGKNEKQTQQWNQIAACVRSMTYISIREIKLQIIFIYFLLIVEYSLAKFDAQKIVSTTMAL